MARDRALTKAQTCRAIDPVTIGLATCRAVGLAEAEARQRSTGGDPFVLAIMATPDRAPEFSTFIRPLPGLRISADNQSAYISVNLRFVYCAFHIVRSCNLLLRYFLFGVSLIRL